MKNAFYIEKKLYNPHGSDVTKEEEKKIPHRRRLYNPHGSDVTDNHELLFRNVKLLYNPHGSDVTDLEMITAPLDKITL